MKLTSPRERSLRRLAQVAAGKVYVVGGHGRTACGGLVELGLAECLSSNVDSGLRGAFRITDAGRKWVEDHP